MTPAFDDLTATIVSALPPPLMRRILVRWGLDGAAVGTDENRFDRAHYERSQGRRFRSDEVAVLHYLLVGSRRGMRPRSDFDPADYLRRNPDVALAGYEPFAHYLRFGRREGRGDATQADPPHEDLEATPNITRVLTRRPSGFVDAKVDVIVPVYGNRRLALQAIDSVLAAQVTTAYELIVVDDASDERQLREDLAALAAKGLLTLLINERNLGFVGSANRGLGLHGDRDVVLLNSDTRVFDGWLDRLMSALRSTPRTATATPLSNAATILSYPVTMRDNMCLLGMDFALLDRLCADLRPPLVELPTGVGFCMAMSRACLNKVGAFDAERFGRGYGEENDFCLRATAAGWRHVAATNVFVWHRGGGSFGAEREARLASALETLEQRYPDYREMIKGFMVRDPLQSVRASLDAARIRSDPRAKLLWSKAGAETMGSTPHHLALALVPDVGPFFGQYRIAVRGYPPVPNLIRLGRGIRPDTLQRLLNDLAVEEIRLMPQSLPAPIVRSLHSAARMAGIVIKTQTA